MNELVTINDVELPVVEMNGQRVVTLAMVDQAHQRPDGTAGRNFRENRSRLIESVDFFEITQPDEIRRLGFSRPQGGTPSKVILLTESGYMMLVKSFTDDLAWSVQRQLVNCYFKVKQSPTSPANLSRLQLIEIAMQAEQERIQLEHKVEVMTPKVEGFDRLATVAQGSFCIRDAAKNLQVQEKQLIQLLIEERWVYRRPMGSGMLAYSDKLQQGLMEHKVTTGEKSDGSEWTSTQARITVKGLTKLSLMFSSIHQFSRPVVPANGMVLQ